MSVPVRFPDGTIRNIPGQLQYIHSSSDRSISIYEQVPLNCDPDWKYERAAGQWIARRRIRQVTTLCPPIEEWWRSIRQMADDTPDAGPEGEEGQTLSRAQALPRAAA